jgi:hypothetical protein
MRAPPKPICADTIQAEVTSPPSAKVNEAPQKKIGPRDLPPVHVGRVLSRYSSSALHVERLLCLNGLFLVIFAREAAQVLRKQELRNRDAEDFQKAEHGLNLDTP